MYEFILCSIVLRFWRVGAMYAPRGRVGGVSTRRRLSLNVKIVLAGSGAELNFNYHRSLSNNKLRSAWKALCFYGGVTRGPQLIFKVHLTTGFFHKTSCRSK